MNCEPPLLQGRSTQGSREAGGRCSCLGPPGWPGSAVALEPPRHHGCPTRPWAGVLTPLSPSTPQSHPQPRKLAVGVEPIVWDPAGAEWWPWEAVWAPGTPGSDPVCVSVPDHQGTLPAAAPVGLGCPPEGSGRPQCPCCGAGAVATLILRSWCDLRDTILTPVRGRSQPQGHQAGWSQSTVSPSRVSVPVAGGKGWWAACLHGTVRGTVWLQAHPNAHCLKMAQFGSLLTHFMGFPLLLIYGKIALSHLSTKGRPEPGL